MLTLVLSSFLAATPSYTGNVSATPLQPSHTVTMVADDSNNKDSQDSSKSWDDSLYSGKD
jgi:hypothetical protein